MAGGPSTVGLAAAVCEAGGLGFLASGYVAATTLARQVAELRERTNRPFGVNVFVIPPPPVDRAALAVYLRSLQSDASRLGVELGDARFDDDEFDMKLSVVAEARVPVVSFTFGCPSPETVRVLQAAGSQVWLTVTSVAEAQAGVKVGCDALVAQGAQAGGHRGAFSDDGGAGALETCPLVRALATSVDLPLVAAGGIATARDVQLALEAGATAVQAGTAFLLADEAGTHPLHRAAVASDTPTDWTRSFTGRTARGVVNAFMQAHKDAPAAYPHIHHATAPLRSAARAAGDGDAISLWAGTRHSLARPGAAAEILRSLAAVSG